MKDYCLIMGINRSSKMRLRQYHKRTKNGKNLCFGVYILNWNEKTQRYITHQINREDTLIYYATSLTRSMLKHPDVNSHLLITPTTRPSKERTGKWVKRNMECAVCHICYGTYILRCTKKASWYAEKHLKDPDIGIYVVKRIVL